MLRLFGHRRRLFIQTLKTPNVQSLMFKPTDMKLMNAQQAPIEFETLQSAMKSQCQMAQELLQVPRVKSIMMAPEYVSVQVDDAE